MTERVQVVVEAKDAASGVLRAITGQFGALGSMVEELTASSINWGTVFQMGAQVVASALQESIKATTQYAEEVRNLSMVSGQSAEDTSRMLQVLDDFQLTADDATTAVRTLTKEGLAPTLETMASLSDQYLQLNTAQEKNEFILKNLGRSGLQWANMLSKGGDAIREMSDAVDENLILTQDNINAAEDYRLALDDWNDAVQGLKVSLGNELLPVLADVLAGLTNFNEVSLEVQKTTEYANMSIFERARAVIEGTNALTEQEQAERAASRAITETTGAVKDNTAAAQENTDAVREQSRANQTLLNNMFSLQSEADKFTQGEEDRAAKLKEIDAKKIALALEMNRLRQDGELTIERQNSLVAEQLGLEQQYQQVLKDGQKALEDKEAAGQKVIYSLLEQKAAADGLVSSDETRFLQDTAVSMGLVDRASADAAIQASETADAFWAGFQQTGQSMTTLEATVDQSSANMQTDFKNLNVPMDKTRSLMQAIAGYDGRVISYSVAFSTSGSLGSGAGLGLTAIGGGRANGGSVYAGMGYVVGERGPEWFAPETNGQIIPNDKMRPSVNITINGNFRNINDLDYLAQEVVKRMK